MPSGDRSGALHLVPDHSGAVRPHVALDQVGVAAGAERDPGPAVQPGLGQASPGLKALVEDVSWLWFGGPQPASAMTRGRWRFVLPKHRQDKCPQPLVHRERWLDIAYSSVAIQTASVEDGIYDLDRCAVQPSPLVGQLSGTARG